jgi:hypothetical protein
MDMPTFDELMDLAHRDPEGFERLRTELIDDCIRCSSEHNQRRLQGRQFVIEARRQVSDSPMKALLNIQGMMYDSALGLQKALLGNPGAPKTSGPTRTRVLPFRRPLPSKD